MDKDINPSVSQKEVNYCGGGAKGAGRGGGRGAEYNWRDKLKR